MNYKSGKKINSKATSFKYYCLMSIIMTEDYFIGHKDPITHYSIQSF